MEIHNKQFDKLTREQKTLTKMMDNLYLDKLKGTISEEDYERFYTDFKDKKDDINTRLIKLQNAENDYYITAKYLLELANRAHTLFESSEVEEKRLLIKLVLSNLRLKGKEVVCEVNKPFDLILECNDSQVWCARQDSNLRPTD